MMPLPQKLRWAVVTPHFPTTLEPYRGSPVWATLRELSSLVNLDVWCSLPHYFLPHHSRKYLYSPPLIPRFRDRMYAEIVTYPTFPWVGRPLNGFALYRALRERIRAAHPQLLLAYWVYPDGYAAVRLGRELGIPVAVSPRGSDLRIISQNPVLRRHFRYTMENAAAVIAVSRDLSQIAGRLGSRAARTHTLHNGVDTETFSFRDRLEARRALGIAPQHRLILYVGRLVAMKGLAQLVEAVCELNREDPAANWRTFIIGEGPFETDLRALIRRFGSEAAVTLLGSKQPAEVAQWLNAVDFFCLPSESEGCPNVVLEALSCGLPVVATAVGGIPEILPEASGILIRDNRPQTIRRALIDAAARTWDRKEIVRTGQHSWREVAETTFRICQQLT